MTCVGIDIAKDVHWVCAVDREGALLLNHKLLNTPEDMLRLAVELEHLPAPIRVGIDILSGIAVLTQGRDPRSRLRTAARAGHRREPGP